MLVQAIVFLAVAAVAFYYWKSRDDRDYLWLSEISAAGLLLKIWDYLPVNVIDLPLLIRVISDALSVLVWCGFIFLVCKIIFMPRKN
jgi:hypothetical protein